MEKVKAYLYDARGEDVEVSIDDVQADKLTKDQLLWVNVLARDEALLNDVAAALKIENVPVKLVVADDRRLDIDRFESFFRFSVDSVITKEDSPPERLKVDYIVGKNFIITVHEGEVEYFQEFRKREKRETPFGKLDAEIFVATLLDLNVVSYFAAVNEIERQVDQIDERVLKRELETDEFLKMMVELRRDVSHLRRWLAPHREVFYSLSRADFQKVSESDSEEEFKMLNRHFESAIDAVDRTRETVLSVFELYATKSSQLTNVLIRRLTFFTLVVGMLAVVAGIFGMNYQLSYFEGEEGFWVTVSVMAIVAAGATFLAWAKRWI